MSPCAECGEPFDALDRYDVVVLGAHGPFGVTRRFHPECYDDWFQRGVGELGHHDPPVSDEPHRPPDGGALL